MRTSFFSARHLLTLPVLLLLTGGLFFTNSCKNKPDQDQSQQTKPAETQKPQKTKQKSSNVNHSQVYKAALKGKLNRVQQALNSGFDANRTDRQGRTALMYACYNGHTHIIEELLNNGAKVNLKDAAGRTALMFASSGSFPKAVEMLLKHDAKVNLSDKQERFTALMFAASEGNTKVAEILLEHGADPTISDNDNETALDFARNNGHEETAQLLESQMQ